MFELSPQLESGTRPLIDLDLCTLRLLKDPQNPWLMLVPKRAGMTEIHQLSPEDQQTLITEIAFASKLLEEEFAPDKINVGALGNIVSTLHIHVIARYETDRAWPGPIWGVEVEPDDQKLDQIEARVRRALG